jgi:hypothetical protein
MHQAIKNVAKAPMIARYTWLAIMVAAMICADQWSKGYFNLAFFSQLFTQNWSNH